MDDFILYVLIGILIALVIKLVFIKSKGNSEKITDIDFTLSEFKKILGNFKLSRDYSEDLTERKIQSELYKYLSSKYETVTTEYSLEGKNISRIDIDIGDGNAGIELKIAKKLINNAQSTDRLVGQLKKYYQKRYKNGNLFLIIVGTETEFSNSIFKEIKSHAKDYKTHVDFLDVEKDII